MGLKSAGWDYILGIKIRDCFDIGIKIVCKVIGLAEILDGIGF
jgi:hypothetical protein